MSTAEHHRGRETYTPVEESYVVMQESPEFQDLRRRYRGWVLPGRSWVPVDGFPLAAHQARTAHVSERGLLARALWPSPRYVNSVLFLPKDQGPSGPG